MRYERQRMAPGVNAGSMADVAFLLLTFFLITTQINNDRGISLLLPQFSEAAVTVDMHDRNLFKVQINAQDELLIENEVRSDLAGLREELKRFILNNGRDDRFSESPAMAVVSLKTDRGTSYHAFIAALDEIQAAYYEIYAARAGMTPEAFRQLDPFNAEQNVIYQKARAGIPMNISIAEPTAVSGGGASH